MTVSPPRIPRSGVQRLNRESMTAVMVLLSAVGVPTAENEHRFREQLAAALENARKIGLELQHVLTKFCGLRFQPPSIELPPFANGFDSQAVLEAFTLWAEQIVAQFDWNRIGGVRWHGRNRCTLEFVVPVTKPGVINKETQFSRHRHELVHVRVHPASSPELALPRRASAILRHLDLLLPHTAILTGTLVGQGQETLDTVKEPTAFGRIVHRGVAATKQGIQAAGHAAANTAKGAGRAARVVAPVALGGAAAVATGGAALMVMAAMFAGDPGILLGDRVIIGWKE